MKNKTVLGLALLCVLLLVGLVLTFLRVSDLKTTIADLETSTDQQITDLETSTDQQITDLETSTDQQITDLETSTDQQITNLETLTEQRITGLKTFTLQLCSIRRQVVGGYTWDCEFPDPLTER